MAHANLKNSKPVLKMEEKITGTKPDHLIIG